MVEATLRRTPEWYGERRQGNQGRGRNDFVSTAGSNNELTPTLRENKEAIQHLKNNKSAGRDGIGAELIKMGPGLNAPLFRRQGELSLFGTLNINASVHYWMSQGLEKSKIVIGLPTYGHSYQLVNSFNTRIGAPASSYGRTGMIGYASYSEICWFRRHNIYVHQVYDVESCSPYLYAGTEWISYEDERSLECKANWIKENGFGGAMIFSLNTDDFGQYCADSAIYSDEDGAGLMGANAPRESSSFPLLRKIHSILADKQGVD